MDKKHWIVPIWTKEKHHDNDVGTKELCYSYPDWGNVGPRPPSPLHTNYTQATDMWSNNNQTSRTSFTMLKDVQRKFPLQTTYKYSYPLLQPVNYYNKSVPGGHRSLAGNCLDVFEVGGHTVVVHLEQCDDQQAVAASRLVPGGYHLDGELIKGDPLFHLEKEDSILLDQSVYQTVSRAVNNGAYVLVRTPSTVQLASLGQPGLVSTNQETFGGWLTSDIALNSILPGLWSLACVGGEVTVHDPHAQQPLWTTHFRKSGKVLKNNSSHVYKCEFGRHPLSLVVGSESSLWLCDTREQPHTHTHTTLFDVTDMKDYISVSECICSFVPASGQPHLYVVMDECVFVVDERHCRTPLMYWRHMLPQKPSFTTLQKFDELEVLMLANSQEKKVCMIVSEWEHGSQQCQGVGVPRHFPTTHDTVNFAHTQDLWFTHQVQERLEDSRWLGTASLVHPTNNDRMVFLSLHNNGDIFSHSFQTLHSKTDLAESFEAIQQGHAILNQWEMDVVEASTHNWSDHAAVYFDATCFFHQVCRKSTSVLIEEMLADLPEINFDNENTISVGTKTNDGKKTKNTVSTKHEKKTNDMISIKSSNAIKLCINTKSVPNLTSDTATLTTIEPQRDSKSVWSVKEQVQRYRHHKQNKKSQKTVKKHPPWIEVLVEAYIIDPFLDPSLGDLPILSDPSHPEEVIDKFLPRTVVSRLQTDKIKDSVDFIAPRILSLWLGGRDGELSSKDEDIIKGGQESTDTNFSGVPKGVRETSARGPGFKYHTAPVDLSHLPSMPAKLEANQKFTELDVDDPRSDLEDTCQSVILPSQATSQGSQNTTLRSRKTKAKIKKKQRLDGF